MSTALVTFWMSDASLVVTACGRWLHDCAGGACLVLTVATYSDPLSQVLKLTAVGFVAVAFLYSRDYLRANDLHKGEFYVLGLFGLLGMMIMISANSLLTMYLGLETLALSLYALVAIDRNNVTAAESAMKYFVLGAIASGALLYGISWVYGVTGTLMFDEIAAAIAADPGLNSLPLWFGLAFLVVGIAFKFGAVPFHMWLPDVYQVRGPRNAVHRLGAQARGARIHDPHPRRRAGRPARLGRHAHGRRRPVAACRQCRRDCADKHQAHAGLFDDCPRRLHFARYFLRHGEGLRRRCSTR